MLIKTKVIFFDIHQTLIDIDINRGKENKKDGFEKIIVPYLLTKNLPEPEALLAQSYYTEELKNFYSNKDIEIFQHDFPDILSKTFSKHYGLILPKTEINNLVYQFRKISRGHLRLYEGVIKTLEVLSAQYTLAVASHTQGVYSERELEELNLLKYFKYRIYSSDIGFKKRSDNFYQKCLEIVNLEPNNCVMVGDNLYEDIYIASKNGFHTVWIINPLTKDENKVKVQPKASLPIEYIKNLPNIIENVWN